MAAELTKKKGIFFIKEEEGFSCPTFSSNVSHFSSASALFIIYLVRSFLCLLYWSVYIGRFYQLCSGVVRHIALQESQACPKVRIVVSKSFLVWFQNLPSKIKTCQKVLNINWVVVAKRLNQ
jgi:hypothetical protein